MARNRSRMPVLDGLTGLIVAAELDTGAEERDAALAVEPAAELLSQGVEAGGGDRGQVTLGQLGLDPAQLLGEGFEPVLFRGEGLVYEVLPLDSAEVLNGMLVLAAPVDEGAFGDAELGGDAGKADASGAQLDEFLNRFLIFHKWRFVTGAKRSYGDRSGSFPENDRFAGTDTTDMIDRFLDAWIDGFLYWITAGTW